MTEPSRRRGSGAGAAILALTQGDPAGIGPEITLKAWLRRDEIGLPFCLLGDPDLMRRTVARLGLSVPVERATIADAADVSRRALPVAPVGDAAAAEPGKPDPATAAATLASIEEAVRLPRARGGRGPRPHPPPARPGRGGGPRPHPDREARPLPGGLFPPGPHRVPGGAVGRARPDAAASGHDAVVRGARRRAGDRPHPAGAGSREPDDGADRQDVADRRRRPAPALRHRAAAARARRAQPARRRERLAWRRGRGGRRARGCGARPGG